MSDKAVLVAIKETGLESATARWKQDFGNDSVGHYRDVLNCLQKIYDKTLDAKKTRFNGKFSLENVEKILDWVVRHIVQPDNDYSTMQSLKNCFASDLSRYQTNIFKKAWAERSEKELKSVKALTIMTDQSLNLKSKKEEEDVEEDIPEKEDRSEDEKPDEEDEGDFIEDDVEEEEEEEEDDEVDMEFD